MFDTLLILLTGLFLPLFPMSMVFNAILDATKAGWLKALLLFIWPLAGVFILQNTNPSESEWIIPLALFTSALYALRILTLREVNQWSGFLATSFWSLLWLSVWHDTSILFLYIYAVSMTVPLVLLVFLSTGLEHRFGAAYTGLYGGLARTIPRFSGILVIVVVAAIASPLFPTFFIMLDMIVEYVVDSPFVAVVLLLIWLLWSWAGARLIQGLIVGRASDIKIPDLGNIAISLYTLVLLALSVAGIYLSGEIL